MSITNPNASRLAPETGYTMNPFGSVFEQIAGRFAPQTNVPGTPTNTNWFPRQQYGFGQLPQRQVAGPTLPQPQYGAALLSPVQAWARGRQGNQGTPTVYAGVQGARDAGKSWGQVYGLARSGEHGFSPQEYYQARSTSGNVTGTNTGAAYAATAQVNQPPAATPRRPQPFGGY